MRTADKDVEETIGFLRRNFLAGHRLVADYMRLVVAVMVAVCNWWAWVREWTSDTAGDVLGLSCFLHMRAVDQEAGETIDLLYYSRRRIAVAHRRFVMAVVEHSL